MNFPSQKLFFFFIPVLIGLALFVSIRGYLKPSEENTNQELKVVAVESSQNIEIKEIDTDQDSVPDWEENLWNTDPNKKNSNPEKISDRAYIDNKKQAGQEENIPKDVSFANSKNKTETLGKVVFTEYLALKQSGRVDLSTIDQMTARIANDVALTLDTSPKYTMSSLRITPSNEQSLKKYADTVALIRDKYFSDFATTHSQTYILASGSTKQVEKILLSSKDYYQKMTKDLLVIPVPDTVASVHLELINNYAHSAENLGKVSIVDEDPLSTMLGLKQYEDLSENEVEILKKMGLLFAESGILFTSTDPAFLIWGT